MRTMMLASAGLIATSFGGLTIPTTAQAQALPPGSWQTTCDLGSIDSARGVMSARCGTGKDGPGDDIEEDLAIEWHYNRDFQYSDCGGPIDNIFGNLRCPIDQAKLGARLKNEADAKAAADASQAAKDKAAADLKYQLDFESQVAAATPGMRAAAILILGRDLGNQETHALVGTARTLAYQESRTAIMTKEFDFSAAATFLKKYLARSGGEKYRNGAVDAAFLQVYGRLSTPAEQVDYYNRISAGKAWYATIVGDQMPNIAAGTQIRAGIAQRVAESGFGRDPALPELTEWTRSGQNYGTMIEGVRQKLWSGSADELISTVQRALKKINRPSDDAAVKAAITAWRPMRPVYFEMVGPIGKAKLGNGRPASPIRS